MKHNRIIILAATAMAFAGCSSTDDLEGQGGKELKFTSDISAITPVKMETRASVLATSPDIEAMTLAEKDTILPENQILTRTDSWSARSTSDVAVQIGGGNVYKYTVDNNGVLSSSSTYYFTSLSDQTVAAWFPYSAAFSQFSVKGDQRTLANYNASDLLYATCTVNQNSTGNDLTFAHKTAKIIVNVTVENANYLLNSTINSVTLSGVNLTGSFSNGTLTATNTTGTVQMYNSSASTVTGTTAAATFEACVAPKSSTGDITVTVNVGGTNYTGTLSGGKNLRAGYGHNISVKISCGTVYIYSGNTISPGDYYCINDNLMSFVVKKADLTAAKNKYGATPIAVVVSTSVKHDIYSHGIACALYNYTLEGDYSGFYSWYWAVTDNVHSMYCEPYITTVEQAKNDLNSGYNGQIKYQNNTTYDAFHYLSLFENIQTAGRNPAKTNNSGWYLPSIGEWIEMYKNLVNFDLTKYGLGITEDDDGSRGNDENVLGTQMGAYFTPVGGYEPTKYWLWTSSECSANTVLIIKDDYIKSWHKPRNSSIGYRAFIAF